MYTLCVSFYCVYSVNVAYTLHTLFILLCTMYLSYTMYTYISTYIHTLYSYEIHNVYICTTLYRYFPPVHVKDKKNTFFVKHFAGKIKYTVGVLDNDKDHSTKSSNDALSWVTKNNDTSPGTLKEVCDASTQAVVRALYSQSVYYEDLPYEGGSDSTLQVPNGPSASTNARRRPSRGALKGPIASTEASKVPPLPSLPLGYITTTSYSPRSIEQRNALNKTTIATSFSYSMYKLNTYLVHTNCLFIRCIKPNVSMEPDIMDNEFIGKGYTIHILIIYIPVIV